MVRPRRERQIRGKGLRTRSGCVNCRARRVKCDEINPVCTACQRRHQECVYPSPNGQRVLRRERQDDQHAADGLETPHAGPQAGEFAAGSNHILPNERYTLSSGSFDPPASISSTRQEPYFICHNQLIDSPPDSAEAASRLWFGLLTDESERVTTDVATRADDGYPEPRQSSTSPRVNVPNHSSETAITLNNTERALFEYFVRNLSRWIDITDPNQSFGIVVSHMAVRSKGLMKAILALAARHLSQCARARPELYNTELSTSNCSAIAVQCYQETLQYLHMAMQDVGYLRSDELLAAVLLISTYEMLESSGKDWERHLKGVFWIQRSQQINGETDGLKQRIWWAWLRQDIWAAFKCKRKILSFYKLTRPCFKLDFWELVNRSFFLLGQCVNYASKEEQELAEKDLQLRIRTGNELITSLEEWATYFVSFDRRLPAVAPTDDFPFEPIWAHPPAASIALQAHHLSRVLMLDHRPATGGLRELGIRSIDVETSLATICGLACCTTEPEAAVVSVQCLLAMKPLAKSEAHRKAVSTLIEAHQKLTGWPADDMAIPGFSSPEP